MLLVYSVIFLVCWFGLDSWFFWFSGVSVWCVCVIDLTLRIIEVDLDGSSCRFGWFSGVSFTCGV